MTTYYNEHDPFAAAWLRELIKAGQIAPGEVDERDIQDITPRDLAPYAQCHFFAGIGGWSYALRLAGWPDDKPVWTGSCPCQPFSAAGKGDGFADERHLWPAWFHLIEQCRPGVVFGEQVEAAIKHGWLDLVQDDLEGIGYAVGAVGLPAASVGAPHIRQRLWFVAESDEQQRDGFRNTRTTGRAEFANNGELGDPNSARSQPRQQTTKAVGYGCTAVATGGVEHATREQMGLPGFPREHGRPSSFWSACDWLPCLDGKARPVEPGTFPLAHGVSARVGRLRGYGNAIAPQVAETFIRSFLE